MANNKHKGRGSILIIALCAVLLLGIVAAMVLRTPEEPKELKIVITGDKTITVEYGETFQDPQMKVLLGDEEVQAQITPAKPPMTELGTYTVTYTVKYEEYSATESITVEVVDTVAPVIELLYVDGYKPLPGEKYQEEGYKAYDAHDGELTDRVQRMVVDNVVYYKVTDSSGNSVQVERPIVYADIVAPELSLLGNTNVVIDVDAEYVEPGFTATDDIDGDLTDKVQVEGEYDTSVAGTYTITYTVTDSSGNTTKVKRTLIVRGKGEITVVDPGNKVIYLTFDDGPSEYTLQLLDVLAKYDVKATFFVVGKMSLEYLDEIVAGGHAIGLHSNTHDYEKIYASDEAFLEDMMLLREKIYERTGIYTNITRFPGGSSNTVSKRLCKGIMTRLTQTLTEQGFRIFDWNVDSDDAGSAKTTQEVVDNVIKGIKKRPVSVVLQHDIRQFSVDAVEQIIIWALDNGYTFLPLDETSPICQHTIAN